MSKWIDADALIAKMPTVMDMQDTYLPIHFKEWLIDEAPSIDIVRCAECKYKQQCHKAVEHTTHKPTSVTIAYRPIDFCSYGERKESE